MKKIKQKTVHKKSRCENGHLQNDVYKANVVNIHGHIIAQRFKCRSCRQTLTIDHNENLIGNPFGIVERTEEYRDRLVLLHAQNEMLGPIREVRVFKTASMGWTTLNTGENHV